MDMNDNISRYIKELENNEKIKEFKKILLFYNEKFNLTSITDDEEIFYKHFLDSLAGEFLFKSGASVCEVGSGAGFPSIVLKIFREDLSFSLIESTGKKCSFLKEAIKELSLDKVEVINSRAEDMAKDPVFREKFDCSTARAVAKLNSLCEYCIPFIKKGGNFIAYKGEAEEEVKEASSAIKILGGKLKEVYSYDLCGYGKRSLVNIEKLSSTPAAYPRGSGKERSKPL